MIRNVIFIVILALAAVGAWELSQRGGRAVSSLLLQSAEDENGGSPVSPESRALLPEPKPALQPETAADGEKSVLPAPDAADPVAAPVADSSSGEPTRVPGDPMPGEPAPSEETTSDSEKTDVPAVITGEIRQGETAEEILSPFVTSQTFHAMLQASRSAHPLGRIREGQTYMVVRAPETGDVERFVYEIDRDKQLVINRTETGFMAQVEPIKYDVETSVVQGKITSSLFQAIASTGENPDLAIQLSNIFGSEINFIKDLREGDTFALVVEKRYRDGTFSNYGSTLAARFVNQGKLYEGFRFAGENGAPRFFNAKGESLAKTLLKAPLSFTRVTSGYSMNRRHPVYFDKRPHQGVDYGAPSGTPVKAVGDGTVNKAGWGNGFGNMIVIKHAGSLESMYSHLSGFAKGVRSGTRVRQGQVVGYVGSTGVSTGPHLDFRLKQNGRYVNPTKFVAPRGNPVPSSQKKAFDVAVREMRALMGE